VEHVVDMQKLPELKVNSMHDSELRELETEQQVILLSSIFIFPSFFHFRGCECGDSNKRTSFTHHTNYF